MPLSLKDFTSVLRSLPKDASQDQINQAAKAAESGTPLGQLWDLVNRPIGGSADALVPALRHEHGDQESGLRRTAEDFGAALTSPVNVASTAFGVGGAVAGARGALGISKAARYGEAALQAPYVVEGVNNMVSGDNMGERLAGVAEAGMGAYFGRQALQHSFPVKKVAQAYMKERGLPFDGVKPEPKIVPEQAMRRADDYVAMDHAPNSPLVKQSYDSLGSEIEKQYDFLVNKAGVKIEPWTSEGQPYASSKHMVEDVEKNNHLWYFPSEQGFGMEEAAAGNPLLAKGARNGVVLNDQLRAVHDYFGHAQHGFEFGPKGEEGAWMEHTKMLPKDAVGALTTETRGQNSFVNFGPHMRNAEGALLKKGDEGFLPPQARPFAEQKTGLLPESIDAEQALNGPYGILSAAKSDLSPEENAARHQQLLAALKGRGAIEQHGVYGGGPEPSVLVPGLSPEETQAFGRQFNQEAVISSQGYHRLADGQTFPARGPARFDPAAQDNYSELNGKRYQLDFPDEAYTAAPSPAAQPPAAGRPLEGRTESLATYEKPNMDDVLQLEHRSTVDGLTEIDPQQWNNGKGMAGAERVLARDYPEHFQKQSFYNIKGAPIEKGLQHYPHTYEGLVEKSKIYDLGEDPHGFLQKARDLAQFDGRQIAALLPKFAKEAGFAGHMNSKAEDEWGRGVVALYDKLPVSKRAVEQAAAGVKGSTALALAGPTASLYPGKFSDDEDTDKRIRTYLGLAGVASLGAAAMFPRDLKGKLDAVRQVLKSEARAANVPVRDSVMKTAVRKVIQENASTKAEADFLEGLYHTIPLPKYEGINFDERKPLRSLLMKGRSKQPEFKTFTTSRLDKLYDVGNQQGAHWGNPEWIQKLVGDDSQLAIKFGRTLGALSPGAKTHENAAQAAEVFVRHILNGEPLEEVLDTMKTIRVRKRSGKELNLQRTSLGGRIYADKTENLSGNELGIKGRIPIDMWLLRAMGSHTDKTPGQGLYRVMEDAFEHYASGKNEDPFTVMAKVWTGMQKVAEAETPSWQKAFEQMGITGDLTNPEVRQWVEKNLPQLKERIYSRKGTKAQMAERQAMLDAIPAAPDVPAKAMRPVQQFQTDVQNKMLPQQYRGDVLGKVKNIGVDKQRLWNRMQKLGVPTDSLDPPKGKQTPLAKAIRGR